MIIYLLIFGVIGVMILMTSRGNKRRQAQALQLQSALEVGVQVRTIGGLLGEVAEITDEHVVIETTPGVKLTFAKNAIAGVTTPVQSAFEPEPDSESTASPAESEPEDAVEHGAASAESELDGQSGSAEEEKVSTVDAVRAEAETANR